MKIECPCRGHEIEIGVDLVQSPKYKIIAIMGPSGCGKSTLLEKFPEIDYIHKVKATTTRPRRNNEGKNAYHFITKEAFLSAKDQMLETTQFREWYYGTNCRHLDLNKWNIGIFSPAAIVQLANNPQVKLEVYYLCVDEQTRLRRALNRESNLDVDELFRRIQADRIDFSRENLPFKFNQVPCYTEGDLQHIIQDIIEYVIFPPQGQE